jgi:hypothetical protein
MKFPRVIGNAIMRQWRHFRMVDTDTISEMLETHSVLYVWLLSSVAVKASNHVCTIDSFYVALRSVTGDRVIVPFVFCPNLTCYELFCLDFS